MSKERTDNVDVEAPEPPEAAAAGKPAAGKLVATRPGRPYRRWRDWLIPRSVLGIVAVLLAFSIGASLSGVVLYSYYEYRLTNTEHRLNNYIGGFDQRFHTASDSLDAEKQNAQAAIQKELEPLRQFQAEGGTLAALVQQVGGSVWFLQTQDQNGAPSVASAFVVASDDHQSKMVTSYDALQAATRSPGPDVFVSKGNDKFKVSKIDNWVEDQDLAVVTVPKGNLPILNFVPEGAQPKVGERVFVASGLGAAGAAITQGFVSDITQTAIQHDSAVGPSFRGGPLLNSSGQLVGVASSIYDPFGFGPSTGVEFSVPIRLTCQKLLKCPPDNNSVQGAASR